MNEIFALSQFAKAKIEDAGSMAVDKHHAQQRRSSEQVRERLEVKMPIDEELSAAEGRGQFVFAPDILIRAGEHGLGVSAVAAQFGGQPDDAFDVGASAVLFRFWFRGSASLPARGL